MCAGFERQSAGVGKGALNALNTFRELNCQDRRYVRNQDSIAMGYSTRVLYRTLWENITKFGEGHGRSMSLRMTEGERRLSQGSPECRCLPPSTVVVKAVPYTKEHCQGLNVHATWTVFHRTLSAWNMGVFFEFSYYPRIRGFGEFIFLEEAPLLIHRPEGASLF